ncbi:MAG: recombination protein RecR [Verrucomicrobiota bacterium]
MSRELHPEALRRLAESLARLPGLGRRSAERAALALLDWKPEDLKNLAARLAALPAEVGDCRLCHLPTDLHKGELCPVCADPRRDRGLICVVESVAMAVPVEKSGYRGCYHVLGGKLSPLDGVGPGDLHLDDLRRRAAEAECREILLATSTDIEGQATAAYVAELVARPGLLLSRLAQGIPLGADLSHTDSASMAMAIARRNPF